MRLSAKAKLPSFRHLGRPVGAVGGQVVLFRRCPWWWPWVRLAWWGSDVALFRPVGQISNWRSFLLSAFLVIYLSGSRLGLVRITVRDIQFLPLFRLSQAGASPLVLDLWLGSFPQPTRNSLEVSSCSLLYLVELGIFALVASFLEILGVTSV